MDMKITAFGTAWFSDFKIEAGLVDESNTWNFLCVLFDYVNANIEQNGTYKNVTLRLTQTDKEDMRTCMRRFQSSMEQMTNKKIRVKYDLVESTEPITSFSHDEENGYYVSGYDIKNVLDPYIAQGKYDHIFVAFRTGDMNQRGAIPVNDWIGLGSMEYRNIGFSNIRLPDSDNNYVYKYDTQINQFPEEVFIHEFLHTLERNAEEWGEERPELHSYENYGYSSKVLFGLKDWYQDYMNKNISTTSGKVGLPTDIYTKKPVKTTDFTYTHELNAFKEPNNILEELNNIWHKVQELFTIVQNNMKIKQEQ